MPGIDAIYDDTTKWFAAQNRFNYIILVEQEALNHRQPWPYKKPILWHEFDLIFTATAMRCHNDIPLAIFTIHTHDRITVLGENSDALNRGNYLLMSRTEFSARYLKRESK